MSRGVILNANPSSGGNLQIIVPRGYEDEKVLIGGCLVCGAKFYRGQEAIWQRHVVKCATSNIDELRASAPSETNKGTIFDPADRDADLERHFREVGERMRREGRWDVKPNERADT